MTETSTNTNIRGVALDELARRTADLAEQVNDVETGNDDADSLIEDAYQSLRAAQDALDEALESLR